MYSILSKTFGGLSRQYYLRNLFFGILIATIPLSNLKIDLGIQNTYCNSRFFCT